MIAEELNYDIPMIVTAGYLMAQPRQAWLIEGLIRQGTIVFLNGKEGTGKSFVALEMASCIAGGTPFYRNAVAQGDVLYVASERSAGMRERLEALEQLKGYRFDNLRFVPRPLLLDGDGESQLYEWIESEGIKPKLIIYDTLRASFEGDENSSAIAQKAMSTVHRINERYGSTAVVVHHVNGWNKNRGSSAFIAAADTELNLTESTGKQAGKVHLKPRKQNNGRKYTRYELQSRELDFGDGYSSIVFDLVDIHAEDTTPEEDESHAVMLQLIVDIVTEHKTFTSVRKLITAMEGELDTGTMLNRDTITGMVQELHVAGKLRFDKSRNAHSIHAIDA